MTVDQRECRLEASRCTVIRDKIVGWD